MAIGVPTLKSPQAIARKLNLPTEKVLEILSSLTQMGLAEKQRDEWNPTDINIHLSKDSAFNFLNHQNWRTRALFDVGAESSGIHYSSVQTLDEKTFLKIKELILKMIEEKRKLIIDAPEQEIVCFTCDWFKL